MHRASESVASLATALAKAQIELVNPEKSLTGVIPAARFGQSEQSFRYASLANGLDIIRKTLGKHEIAVMQTTAVNQPAGAVILTTMLAHTSGEWISSDWPVCLVSDTAMPRRMGAALTYARRYALFTLVGIAGEDDLDAPDIEPIIVGDSDPSGTSNVAPASSLEPVVHRPATRRPAFRHSRKLISEAQPTLDADQSAATRDRLIEDVSKLNTSDTAIVWARGILITKNTLMTADAVLVEQAFQARMKSLGKTETLSQPAEPTVTTAQKVSVKMTVRGHKIVSAIDKSALAICEPRRVRDKGHLRFVASQPCVVCGRTPSDAHHLRHAQTRAMSRKVSDEFTVPLCRVHHRELHRYGREQDWWTSAGIAPLAVAEDLWRQTRLSSSTRPGVSQ